MVDSNLHLYATLKLKNPSESYQISREHLRDIPLSIEDSNSSALFKKILELLLLYSEIDMASALIAMKENQKSNNRKIPA